MPHNTASERDFWRMAFEQKVHCVVMLNKPTERKKNPYWPSKKERIRSYGDVVKVVLLKEEYSDKIYSWVRKFQVILNPKYYYTDEEWKFDDEYLLSCKFDFHDKSDDELDEHEKLLKQWSTSVNHLQYDDWDDMRVPDDKKVFFQFMHTAVKQHEEGISKGPMIVHCFGGVGRTGTFLVIHSTIRKMTRLGGKAIKVLDLLGMLREERSSLVQTPVRFLDISLFFQFIYSLSF